MARAFDPSVREQRFVLSDGTKREIAELMSDLDLTAKDVVELAVAQLWQRELGEPERDILQELDELKGQTKDLFAAVAEIVEEMGGVEKLKQKEDPAIIV